MDKPDLIAYWRDFFSDLLVGTLKRAFLFGFMGTALGILTAFLLKEFFIFPGEPSGWAYWTLFILALLWYGLFGLFHGLAASFCVSASRKLAGMIGGFHDLFDWLSREVSRKFSKLDQSIPREVMAEKFDDLGREFLRDLRLRGGIAGFLASMFFALILRGLRFLFLDEVAEELSRRPGRQLAPRDIESAMRRVGVEKMLAPITEPLLWIQILNIVLIAITFGIPFLFVWAF